MRTKKWERDSEREAATAAEDSVAETVTAIAAVVAEIGQISTQESKSLTTSLKLKNEITLIIVW